MKTKNNTAAPSEPNHATATAKPCIFTPADRKRLKKLLSKDSFDELMELVKGDPMPYPLTTFDGKEIDRRSMDEISINWWDDGNEEYIYQIGKEVYAYSDNYGDFLVYEENDVSYVIEYSYPREDEYWEEKCADFGVKPPLHPAKRGSNWSCRVWINTFYRDDHVRAGDRSAWVRGDDNKIIWFDSYSAARRWINENKKEHHGYADIQYPKGHYLYAYNEYAPREYKICE